MPIITISSRGRLVLPKRLLDELSIRPGDRVEVRREGNRVVLELEARQRGRDWRRWRGALAGTHALQEHLKGHRDEVAGDCASPTDST